MKTLAEVFANPFTKAWAAWWLAFMVIEGIAIFGGHDQATLSWHVREFFRTRPSWVAALGVLTMVWLTLHFFLDLKR